MDVGAPSNFERMAACFSLEEMRGIILGAHINDEETRETIAAVRSGSGYFLDPHTAVGWKAVDKLVRAGRLKDGPLAVLSTAHPAKFAETVEPLTGAVPVPASLKETMKRQPNAAVIPPELEALKALL